MTLLDAPVRVLIVDDSEDQLFLLRRYFERAGCEVVGAGSAEDALFAWTEGDPELTVIDLFLPGMDGWQLAAHLSGQKPGCAIAITSVLGAEHYPAEHAALPKPVTSEHVRSTLRSMVPRWSAA